ncbi:MAG: hypothetical protein PVI21_02595 [Candidatus Woesebacteria bacterium]
MGQRIWGGLNVKFAAAIFGSLLLYVFGIKVFLPVVVVVLSVMYLPAPKVLGSMFARFVTQVVLSLALLQLAAAIQQIILPWSDFMAVAVLYSVFGYLILLFYGSQKKKMQLITRQDIAGLVVVVMFLLPFGAIICGQDSVYKIVEIAGLQSPDAAHHFENINSRSYDQHLDTTGYPKGFHLGVGFLQDAFFGKQADFSWQVNLVMFFGQYLLMGSLLAVSSVYLCTTWLERQTSKQLSLVGVISLAVAIGLPICTLFLWPYIAHGFLNYYYTIAAFLLGLIFIDRYCFQKKSEQSADVGFMLFAAMMLFYGSSQSWPLVVPIVIAILILTIWPNKMPKLNNVKEWCFRNPALLFVVAIQPLPVVTQIIFTKDSVSYINSPGDLTILHTFVLIAGFAVCLLVMLQKKVAIDFKRNILNVMLPLGLFAALVIFMQQFSLGQAIYFSIKVSLLVEAIVILLGVALLFGAFVESKIYKKVYLPLLAFVPMALTILLIGAGPKPFDDLRGFFRDASDTGKPAFYDQDAYLLAKLGKSDLINNNNAVTLHYDNDKKTIYAHAFLAQTIVNIKYPRTTEGAQADKCYDQVFSNLAYGTFSEQEQKDLVLNIKQCVQLAQQAGDKFYVVTDKKSLGSLKSIIGEDGIEYASQ